MECVVLHYRVGARDFTVSMMHLPARRERETGGGDLHAAMGLMMATSPPARLIPILLPPSHPRATTGPKERERKDRSIHVRGA